MECLDCKISKIPEGHTGQIFLQCEDRAGHFMLCSHCWKKRRDDYAQWKDDIRQKKIDAETRGTGKKKKKGSRRGGPNDHGSSH